jgi:serine/threonine protein kinase/serine phosphatase RsbU (regulator of sigma subunit)/pSer/pThr/pTyr-binding forkhead associated (FHA) protein
MADAADEDVNYSFAIKFCSLGPGPRQAAMVEALLNEAQQLRRVEGPFLARLHQVLDLRPFEAAGWPPVALVSRLIEPSLQMVLDELPQGGERLSEGLILRWARHLFEAVEALHGGYGLVHRNIKPSNVLLQLPRGLLYQSAGSLEGATALLSDLVMACQAGRPAAWDLPQDGWKAPELYTHGEQPHIPTAADDLFSLGLVLRKLIASAEHATLFHLPTLGNVADSLTDADPQQRLVAKHELRALLFPAENRPPSGESAVILRRSAASAPHWSTATEAFRSREPGAVDWIEREGVPGYALLRQLGSGGMGVVYEARDLSLGRLVAIKTLSGRLESRYAVERFRVEAAALGRLNHRNIVQIHGSCISREQPYLILELLPGGDLGSRVREVGPLPSGEVVRLAEALAFALEHAHKRGVIHRDPKPNNVLLAADGTPKLIDFGLAKLLDAEADLTAPGVVMGTPHFMAPELVQGADRADARSDLYSLGATIYYLLTGRPPLEGNQEEMLRQVLVREPIPPRELNPYIPAALEAICLRCLAKAPEDRFDSAAALASALGSFRHAEGDSTEAAGSLADPWATAERVRAAGPGAPTEMGPSSLGPSTGAHLPATTGPVLHVLEGPNKGTAIRLWGDRVVLGRNPDCGVVLPLRGVSREHAQILRLQGRYFIEDKQSRNGTFVNNQAISTRTALQSNDRIRIGDFIAVFVDAPAPAVTEDDFPSSIEELLHHTSQALESQPAERLRLLVEITNNLSTSVELQTLLPEIADRLLRVFRQADRCFLVHPEGDRFVPLVARTRRAAESSAHFSKLIVRRCLNDARAFLSEDASRDDRIQLSQSVVDFRIRSVMCAPLCRADGTAFGVIQLDTQDRSKKFTQEDLTLLCAVANQVALALENARLRDETARLEHLRRELHMAGMVQASMQGESRASIPGYDFFGRCESAREVGGDYFDFFPLSNGKVVITVGDVTGKGIAAALLAPAAVVEARWCFETETDPARAIARLNATLCRITARVDRFISLAVVLLDSHTHTAAMILAGASSPLVRRPRTNQIEPVLSPRAGGPPLGLDPGVDFEPHQITLQPGESLILCTDGIEEALNDKGEQFGLSRIESVLEATGEAAAKDVVDRLFATVQEFESGRECHDDQTVVVVTRRT